MPNAALKITADQIAEILAQLSDDVLGAMYLRAIQNRARQKAREVARVVSIWTR